LKTGVREWPRNRTNRPKTNIENPRRAKEEMITTQKVHAILRTTSSGQQRKIRIKKKKGHASLSGVFSKKVGRADSKARGGFGTLGKPSDLTKKPIGKEVKNTRHREKRGKKGRGLSGKHTCQIGSWCCPLGGKRNANSQQQRSIKAVHGGAKKGREKFV